MTDKEFAMQKRIWNFENQVANYQKIISEREKKIQRLTLELSKLKMRLRCVDRLVKTWCKSD